jgi:hypothetical protein
MVDSGRKALRDAWTLCGSPATLSTESVRLSETRLLTYSKRRALLPRATSSGAICITVRKLLLAKDLFWLRALFDRVEKATGDTMGLPEKSN